MESQIHNIIITVVSCLSHMRKMPLGVSAFNLTTKVHTLLVIL